MTFSSNGSRSRTAEIFEPTNRMYGSSSDGFHPLGVGREVRGDVALVEAHSLDQLEVHPEGLGLLDGDDPVLTHLVDGLGDQVADLGVGRRDGSHLGDLLLGLRLLGDGLQRVHGGLDGGLDAPLERHRVGAGGHVAQALTDQGPGEHRGGGGAVTSHVIGLLGDFLDQLGPDLLEGVLELDLLGDRYAVIGNGRGAPLLLEHHVAALGAEGHAHGVGELVHPALQTPPGVFVKSDQLGHRLLASSSRTTVSTLTWRVLTVNRLPALSATRASPGRQQVRRQSAGPAHFPGGGLRGAGQLTASTIGARRLTMPWEARLPRLAASPKWYTLPSEPTSQ